MILPPTIPDSCARLLAWCDRRPHQARRIAQKLLTYTAPASADYAWAQLTFGWCLMIGEQTTETIAVLQQAREALQSMGETWGALHAEHGMLRAKLLQGLQADDVEVWDALATRCLAAGFPLEAAQVRIEQMRALNMLWRAVDALALLNETQSILALHDAPHSQARLVRVVGVAQLQMGDFPQATQALVQAAQLFQTLRMPIEIALTLFEQARFALLQDRFYESRRLHAHAHAIFVSWDLPLRSAFCIKNLGIIAAYLGETPQAIDQILTAQHMFEKLAQAHHVADCILNLGNAAFYSGLYELALGSWTQAEHSYTALAMPGMIAISQRNQAEALYQMRQYDSAHKLVTDLLSQAAHGGSQREHAELYQLMGEICAVHGEQAQATLWLARAEESFVRLPNRAAAARVWLAQGMLALQEGHVSDAEEAFQRAQPELEQRGSYYWRVLHGRGRCAEIQGDRAAALSLYTRASAILSQLRHTLADAYASSALFSTARQLCEDALRLALQQQQMETFLQLTEQQRTIALQQQLRLEPLIFHPGLQEHYERQRLTLRTLLVQNTRGATLDRAIAAYLETVLYGRHYGAQPEEDGSNARELHMTELRSALAAYYGDDWTVLVYSAVGEQLVTVSITPTQLNMHIIPVDRPLQRILQRMSLPQYRTYVYQDIPFQSGNQRIPWREFGVLGEQLIPADVRTRLHPDHRLLIVPCSMLHHVPWAALRLQERWLVEQAIMQILPSLTIWADLITRPCTGDYSLPTSFDGRSGVVR